MPFMPNFPLSEESQEDGEDVETDSSVGSSKKPTGVSDTAWQKFQQLKEKRIAMSQKSNSYTKKRKESKSKTFNEPAPGENEKESASEKKGNWPEVKNYLGTLDHLEAACVDQHHEKSGLEKKLERAIAEGDVNEADKLSDELANREFGSKIATAFDAQRFSKRQKEKEEHVKDKKKRKLNWQFEHKEKWEMKANM